jgi:Ribonuclease HepT-like
VKGQRVYDLHAIDAVEAILRYTADGRDAFFEDRKTQDAVIRNIEIVGQAVKGLSDDAGQALHSAEQLRVQAQLDDELGPGLTRELRVDDLVAPVAEGQGWAWHAFEKIRVSAPCSVRERRLVDDLGAGEHRGLRLARRLARGRCAVERRGNRHDVPVLRNQRLEEASLMLGALSDDQLRRICSRLLDPLAAGGDTQVKRGQVFALEEGHEIGSGEKQSAVKLLHER